MPPDEPDLESRSLPEFDAQAPVAAVDGDRYCDDCGYNLRTQPIRRDPRTRVLLIRCPECARFHAANAPGGWLGAWQRRLAGLGVMSWVCSWVALCCGAMLLHGVIVGVFLDETTRHERIGSSGTPTWVLVVNVRQGDREAALVLALVVAILGLVESTVLVAATFHLRRVAHAAMLFIGLALPAGIICAYWKQRYPETLYWALGVSAAFAGCYLFGAIWGLFFGRPIVRGLVRLCVPPAWRPFVAFLWHADGLTPPRGDAQRNDA